MTQTDSPAVALARAHAEAWSNHDWDTAGKMLASDVHIVATSTDPNLPPTDVSGCDDYMDGLMKFAQTVEPGSAQVLASAGDERTSLILLNVRVTLDTNGSKVTLSGARLAFFDENNKLKKEQVVFFAIPE
jgi:SnoaL-like domain